MTDSLDERDAQLNAEHFGLRFAHAQLDEQQRVLLLHGQVVSIEAKPFDVLLCLLKRPGETLTKDELLDLVWPGRVVSEGVLSKAMMKVRALLGDNKQEIIETVHGFGYRLVVAVERVALEPRHQFSPQANATVPHRPNWQLQSDLGEGGHALVWLAKHIKTGELRVFKYAKDAAGLSALKREVTIFRLLKQSLGEDAAIVPILDWNVDQPPYHLENTYFPAGSLSHWLQANPRVDRAVRIELIAQCADALAAAHRVGVLHKDIKPANVLISESAGAPRALLSDFGIGALLDSNTWKQLNITRQGFTQELTSNSSPSSGTPLYIAPELLQNASPTTRSDIYSLGVMLYQTVLGDFRRSLGAGWETHIDDELLREDIAAAANIDPENRISDAGELARRLRNLGLRHQQLLQHKQEDQQRAQERADFLQAQRRRQQWRWASAALSVILALLLAMIWQSYAANKRIEKEAARAQASLDFLADDILAQGDPIEGLGANLTLRAVLDVARQKLVNQENPDPAIAGRLWRVLGGSYRGLGLYEESSHAFEQSISYLAKLSDKESRAERVQLYFDLGDQAMRLAKFEQSQHWYLQGRELAHAHFGAEHTESIWFDIELAWIEFELGHYANADAQFAYILDAVELNKNAFLREYAEHLAALLDTELMRFDQAGKRYAWVNDALVRRWGKHHPSVMRLHRNWGALLRERGDIPAASKMLSAALEILSSQVKPDHPEILALESEYGYALLQSGDHLQALGLLEHAAVEREKQLGITHNRARGSMMRYAQALAANDRNAEALALLERTCIAAEVHFGIAHPHYLQCAKLLAEQLQIAGNKERAKPILELVAKNAANLPATHIRRAALLETTAPPDTGSADGSSAITAKPQPQ